MVTVSSAIRANLKRTAITWMNAASRAAGYTGELPFDSITGEALEIAGNIYHNEDHAVRSNAQTFRTHLSYLHRVAIAKKFWGDDTASLKKVPFKKLPHEMKTIYEYILLSAAIAINKNNPQRVDKVAHLDDKDAVENWLENMWRARHEYDAPFDQDDLLKRALDWENTSGALGYAMNDLVLRFGGTFNLATESCIRQICENTHEIMIEHNLWGEDTKKYTVPYEELPEPIKHYYVLMVMSAIIGFSENAQQDRIGCDHGSD